MKPENLARWQIWAMAQTIGQPVLMGRVSAATDIELITRQEPAKPAIDHTKRIQSLENVVRQLAEIILDGHESEP